LRAGTRAFVQLARIRRYSIDVRDGMKAQLLEDRVTLGYRRVEREDEDGPIEVAIFSGPNARERAMRYVDRP
jgi:hypothetical protein